MPLFFFSNTQTMHIKSTIHTQQHCNDVSKNLTYTLTGFKPGSFVPEADAMRHRAVDLVV
jgi:hypothetical protein